MKLVKSRSPCSNCDLFTFLWSSFQNMNSVSMHVFYWQDILLQHQVLQTEMHCSPGNNQPLPELIVCHFCLFHCIGFCCQMYTCFSLSDLHISLLILRKKRRRHCYRYLRHFIILFLNDIYNSSWYINFFHDITV